MLQLLKYTLHFKFISSVLRQVQMGTFIRSVLDYKNILFIVEEKKNMKALRKRGKSECNLQSYKVDDSQVFPAELPQGTDKKDRDL